MYVWMTVYSVMSLCKNSTHTIKINVGCQDNNSHFFAHPEMLQLQPVAVLLSHDHCDRLETEQ